MAGQVLRYSLDGGSNWVYTKIRGYWGGHFCPYAWDGPTKSGPFHECVGVPADREITTDGVHSVAPILDHFYWSPGFRLERVPDEYADQLKFSYEI